MPFSAGECILDFHGEIVPAVVAKSNSIRINTHFSLQLPRVPRLEWYINHSCIPNCAIDFTLGLPTLVAAKTIKKGQELTYNYNSVHRFVSPFKCGCEMPGCCEEVKGFNCISLVEKIFIQDDLSPYLLRLYNEERKESGLEPYR